MAFVGLTALDTIIYNGFSFTGATQIKVRVEKVLDDAQITVIYHRFIIDVIAFISPTQGANDTDSTMDTLLQSLSHNGADLYVNAAGIGTYINVNRPSGVQDVNWGPKAKVLDWEPIGGNQACEIKWQVETCIPVCENAPRYDGIIALNYQSSFDRDEHGDVTRTTVGYYEIALTRQAGTNIIPDSADDDKYRSQVSVNIPEGFKRREQWACSADKRREDFTFIDTQIPSNDPYPPNVTGINGRQTIRWSRTSMATPVSSLSMEVSPLAGINGAEAWAIFLTILRKRLQAAVTLGHGPFLETIEAEETLFGRPCSFRASWRVFISEGTDPLDVTPLPNYGGLWKPHDFTWPAWHESLKDTAYTSRGTSKLQEAPGTAKIVDLCQSESTLSVASITDSPSSQSASPLGFRNEISSPDKSYLDYNATITVDESRPVVRHSPMQQAESVTLDGSDMLGSQPANFQDGGGEEDVIQERGQGSYRLVFRGHAIRAGYDIPRPELPAMPGLTPIREKANVVFSGLGTFFGVKVVAAAWKITYLLTKAPGVVTAPPNIATKGNDGTASAQGNFLIGP